MGTHMYKQAGECSFVVQVTRGATFRCYDVLGMEAVEVAAEGGVIALCRRVPEEMTPNQARALAAMLVDAAEECESTEAGKKALGGGE